MSALKELKAAAEMVKEAKRQARETAAALVKPTLQNFLKENPEIKTVMWTQYTPYFNDGEPCVFGVHEPEFLTVKRDDFDYEAEGSVYISSYRGYQFNEGVSEATWKACLELKNTLNDLEDELGEIFGDHVAVIVNEDGVSVQEYEHD